MAIEFELRPEQTGITGATVNVAGQTYNIKAQLDAGAGTISVADSDSLLIEALDRHPALRRKGTSTAAPAVTKQARTISVLVGPEGQDEVVVRNPNGVFESKVGGVAGVGASGPLAQGVNIANYVAPAYRGQSDGANLAGVYKTSHMALHSCGNLRFVYTNLNGVGMGPNTHDLLVVRAALEVGGTVYPIFFRGQRDAALAAGGLLISDPLDLDFAKGDLFSVRNYVEVAAGAKWPLGVSTIGALGGGMTSTATAGNVATIKALTDGGVIPTVDNVQAWGPSMIIGDVLYPRRKVPQIALVGDSIMCMFNDANDRGFMLRALGDNYSYVQLARGGEQASNFTAAGRRYRLALAEGCTHAVENYGSNDAAAGVALATIQANLIFIWRLLSARGMKVWTCTTTPRTALTAPQARCSAANAPWPAGP